MSSEFNRNQVLEDLAWRLAWRGAITRNRKLERPIDKFNRCEHERYIHGRAKQLCARSEKKPISEIEFLEAVEQLASDVSTRYPVSDNKHSALNIGTAQKVLSLYLKFNWLFGLCPEPPLAPVDRLIQSRPVPWTEMSTMEAYKDVIAGMKERAADQSLARWEAMEYLSKSMGN